MYTDSHCHIVGSELYDQIDQVIENMKDVSNCMIICLNKEEFLRAVELKKKDNRFKIAWGWYPGDAKEVTDQDIQDLQEAIDNKQIDCIGEIGLDYYWDDSFKDIQKELFIKQIHMANKTNLPISIHMREATKDCMDILKEHAKTKIIFHCFSGSKETMAEAIKMGAYISFAGPITFKNNKQGVECATLCPLGRILTETDSPYLTPTPFRGKQNEPMYVEYTTKKICELKEIELETLCTQISNNFKSLF